MYRTVCLWISIFYVEIAGSYYSPDSLFSSHWWSNCGGFGFAKALLGAPLFSAAGFLYDGQDMELLISLHY
ncbi:MAG: hypothetical protein U5R49_26730 [Deltaproteobacteria bacterium]|nr:hypothetical protein [Deltaproteobacteria bacterium]